jgi:VanZ family protein
MIRADKVAHFVVSLIITIVLAIVIKSVNADTAGYLCGILAGIVTMCIGVGKEIWDKFRGTGFDLMDLAADLGGCVVAVIFSIFM